MVLGLFFLQCAPSEPKEYVHGQAGFKITLPGGWSKTSEDNELFEFRAGNTRLIEVASFDFEVSREEMASLTEQDITDFLTDFSGDGITEYCAEANIRDHSTIEKSMTTWDGNPAYRLKARGYSGEIDASVIVDIIIMIDKSKARGYLFAAQIAESEYEKIKADIESAIASFRSI
jgi:hypothetical protein